MKTIALFYAVGYAASTPIDARKGLLTGLVTFLPSSSEGFLVPSLSRYKFDPKAHAPDVMAMVRKLPNTPIRHFVGLQAHHDGDMDKNMEAFSWRPVLSNEKLAALLALGKPGYAMRVLDNFSKGANRWVELQNALSNERSNLLKEPEKFKRSTARIIWFLEKLEELSHELRLMGGSWDRSEITSFHSFENQIANLSSKLEEMIEKGLLKNHLPPVASDDEKVEKFRQQVQLEWNSRENVDQNGFGEDIEQLEWRPVMSIARLSKSLKSNMAEYDLESFFEKANQWVSTQNNLALLKSKMRGANNSKTKKLKDSIKKNLENLHELYHDIKEMGGSWDRSEINSFREFESQIKTGLEKMKKMIATGQMKNHLPLPVSKDVHIEDFRQKLEDDYIPLEHTFERSLTDEEKTNAFRMHLERMWNADPNESYGAAD